MNKIYPVSLPALLSSWRANPSIGSNIVTWQTTPARSAQKVPLPKDLHPDLANALAKQKIGSLYSHQALAWHETLAGHHVVVVTGTASGKTLCYNLPILQQLLYTPQARGLYLFPTKALAQDQLDILGHFIESANNTVPSKSRIGSITAAVYDGDTPSSARQSIRSNAQIVLTNPDMLHTGILPHHTVWAEFFRNLDFIVIDELHTYRGIFGSHVANTLRRTQRVAHFYGANPQFILTSATIANPVELAERLIEAPVSLIDEDGSAQGARHFIIYNPPVVDKDLGIRRSSLLESVNLAKDLLQAQIQTIIFGRSRRTVEIILNYLRQDSPDKAGEMRGYRSGYLPHQRRSIEKGLRSGEVSVVVATNALELGIDIGGMDAAILVGYPGTIAATRQQAGRAGRNMESAVAIMVTAPDPLDQFLAHHPEFLFERSPERALINPDNLLILLQHLRCAAFELPFQSGECFGNLPMEVIQEYLDFLVETGDLHHRADRYFWMADQYPASLVSLRSASPDSITLLAEHDGDWSTIGQIDFPSAPWFVHPEAVYLHDGQIYQVVTLDLDGKTARLKRTDLDYFTQPLSDTTVEPIGIKSQSPAIGCEKVFGEIKVTNVVKGYRKVRWYTHENIGNGEVSLPPTTLQTEGYWVTINKEVVFVLSEQGLWSNNSNDYGLGWTELRNFIRARDNYRCQLCGMLEGGRAHHVHHKTPFRTYEALEQANRPENLITLCPACHRRVETAVRMRSGLSGLGYALGHLAPIFLMCDSRDLGIHADPQSPLSGGNPTVVIYDQVPAGIGLSEHLFELHDELVLRASELVNACECSDGCPACVGPAGENGVGGKQETLALLTALVANH